MRKTTFAGCADAMKLMGLIGCCVMMAACGGQTAGSDGGSCGMSGRSGNTHCPGYDCPPGQYCGNTVSCVPGCTSDENCGANEFCLRCDGTSVGNCATCGSTCQTQSAACRATNNASQLCMTDTHYGTNGYECPDGTQPSDTNCQRFAPAPGVWCCGPPRCKSDGASCSNSSDCCGPLSCQTFGTGTGTCH